MPIHPSRTNCSQTVSMAVISLVLSSTACWVSVTLTGCASADKRWVPGAPGFWEPRSVFPSRATAGSGGSGAVGDSQQPCRPRCPGVPRTRPGPRAESWCGAWLHRGGRG